MAPLRASFYLAVLTPRAARRHACSAATVAGARLAGEGPNPYSQRQRPLATDSTDAQKRTKRIIDPDRPRHAHGPAFPLLLDAGAPCRGIAARRMPAGAGQDHVRAAPGVPRLQRQIRPDRRILRPSRRLAVVRPQRGGRAALPLSRLEI